jgi:hypothetical protein
MVNLLSTTSFVYSNAFLGIQERFIKDQPFERGYIQSCQLQNAIYLLNRVNDALPQPYPMLRRVNSFLLYTPWIIGSIESQKDFLPQPLRFVVSWTHESIGPLTQIVSVISALFLLSLGQYVIAGLSLGFMILAYCVEKRVFSTMMHRTIYDLGTAATFISGSWLARAQMIAIRCLTKSQETTRDLKGQLVNTEVLTDIEVESCELTEEHLQFSVESQETTLVDLRNLRKDVIEKILKRMPAMAAKFYRPKLYSCFGVDSQDVFQCWFEKLIYLKVYGWLFWPEYTERAQEYFGEKCPDPQSRLSLVSHRIVKMPERGG